MWQRLLALALEQHWGVAAQEQLTARWERFLLCWPGVPGQTLLVQCPLALAQLTELAG